MQLDVNIWKFRLLDRLFWLLWHAFPVVIWLSYRGVVEQSAVLKAELPPDFAACAGVVPQAANFSGAGKTAVAFYFIAQFAVYAVLLGLAHRTIHRFAEGKIYVSGTLRTLGLVGVVIAAWPFFDLVSANLLGLAIRATGDMKTFTPDFFFDIGPLGVGLLIITLRTVLSHAIAMKNDQDLTI